MKRWLRRKLRSYGTFLPFPDVICPRHVKSIQIREGAGVEVSIERTLVYLTAPDPADLWDLVPLRDGECDIHISTDSRELLRTPTSKGTIVHWEPREAIVPYALCVHRHGWTSPGTPEEPALYTQFRCDTRTGIVILELSTPGAFEAAIAFRRPAWRRLWSAEKLVKFALEQLETSQGYKPEVLEEGSRLRWTLLSPEVGADYACIAFHQGGIVRWQARLEANTLPARMRRLVRSVTSF